MVIIKKRRVAINSVFTAKSSEAKTGRRIYPIELPNSRSLGDS